MIRLALVAGVCLTLAGCGERADAYRMCQREAGDRGSSGLGLFGGLGGVALLASERDTAWRERVARCYDTVKLARGL